MPSYITIKLITIQLLPIIHIKTCKQTIRTYHILHFLNKIPYTFLFILLPLPISTPLKDKQKRTQSSNFQVLNFYLLM